MKIFIQRAGGMEMLRGMGFWLCVISSKVGNVEGDFTGLT